MATATGTSIFARARTIATQTATDATQSAVIDAMGGLRATLNHAIREVFRRKAKDQKFTNDISVRHTIAIAGGEGSCPDTIMREFLQQANITDENNSLVSFMNYPIDATNETFNQLGYAWLVGDTLRYRAPSPDLDAFDGDLYVTVPTFPTFPVSMQSNLTFPSEATIEDVVLFLAMAITGQEKYEVVSA